MAPSVVKIGRESRDGIKTTVTDKENDIERVVKTFLSNINNRKKIIGLDIENSQKGRKQNKTTLLQLCDGEHCLIVKLPDDKDEDDDDDDDHNLPLSLFNFLNLSEYTFVGIGIKKTLKKLDYEFGLTCKNAVEVGPATWNLNSRSDFVQGMLMSTVSSERPTSSVTDAWDKSDLNKNQIKRAVSDAYVAFSIGNILLYGFGC